MSFEGHGHQSTGFAIVGPHGNVWTDRLFDDVEQARRYLDNFWGAGKWESREWKLAAATLNIDLDPEFSERVPLNEGPVQDAD